MPDIAGLSRKPEMGVAEEVCDGLYRACIPVPGKLRRINIWLLRDEDGFSVVDTGMRTGDAQAAWEKLLASLPDGLALRRVFVTHLHPDHIGMAGWLMARGAAQFWMTRGEYLSCRVLEAQAAEATMPEDVVHFYKGAGWSEADINTYRGRYHRYSETVSPLPRHYRRLREGQEHLIGGRRWRVVVGSGHSPEHACLYCAESKLLISGDQVLPGISSNVSVLAQEPEANPMADWLGSLHKLKAQIPDDVLVLPAHQHCFTGLHARLDALIADQARAMAALCEALATGPKRVIDLFAPLFGREITTEDFMIYSLATGEATACLNYLCERAEVACETGADGVRYYSLR
ncbi:MBL fold metallo-hydrolase [Granulosicoccaceae sp. 1_MG-2023]|nr:MBL fold metallo-hydrolase [Granulosicoccaceae sp. 1_MG-2023]